ncbi:MAG: hypothetical protein ABL888_09460 [Pirellulaceae bacterium]
MVRTFSMLVVLVSATVACGQESLRVAPPSVCGILSIEEPKLVANAVREWLTNLAEYDDLINLIVPSIVESKSDFKALASFAIDGVQLFGDTQYLAFYVNDDDSIGLVARLGSRQKDAFEEWRSRSLPHIELQDLKAEDNLFEQLLGVIAPKDLDVSKYSIRGLDNHIIFATNSNFADALQNRVEKLGTEQGPFITENRRFARSFGQIKKTKDSIGFAYFVPSKFAPLVSEVFLEKKTLAAYGIDELVSCSIDLRFERIGEQKLFSASCFMPTTMPRVGLAALWETYQPIALLPPLADFIANKEPIRLRIENKSKFDFWEKQKAIHESDHGAGTFIKDMDQQFAFLGGFQTIFNSNNGQTAVFWFSEGKTNGMVKMNGIDSRSGAVEYQRQLADFHLQDDGKFPFEEVELGHSLISWFRSDNVARAKFVSDYERNPQAGESLQNHGAIVGENWTISGEKQALLSPSFKSFDSEIEFANEIKSCFPTIGHAVFNDGFEPSWLEVNWTNGRRSLVSNFSYEYLKKKYKNKALEKFRNSQVKKYPHIDPEDYQDRLFALSEIVLNSLVVSMEADVTEFRCSGSNNEWRYIIVPKEVRTSNRTP